MAIQAGKTKLLGRVGNMIYYRMNGKYYARSVSSLSGRRVKRDPKFKRTMEFANLFGKASKLASEVHRSLPPERRNYQLFRKMTGLANQMLKDGIDEISLAEALRKMAWNSKKRLPVKDKKKQAINGEERSPKKLDIAEIGQPQAVLNHSVGVLRYKPTGIPCDNAPRLKKNVGVIDPMQQCAVGSGLFRYTLTRQLQTEYCLILLP